MRREVVQMEFTDPPHLRVVLCANTLPLRMLNLTRLSVLNGLVLPTDGLPIIKYAPSWADGVKPMVVMPGSAGILASRRSMHGFRRILHGPDAQYQAADGNCRTPASSHVPNAKRQQTLHLHEDEISNSAP